MSLLLPAAFAGAPEVYGQTEPPALEPTSGSDLLPPSPRRPPAIKPHKRDRPSKAYNNGLPKYPPSAVCAGIHGTVVMVLSLDSEGTLFDKRIERSSREPLLDRAALEATRHWRFDPEIRGGSPVASRLRVPVDFVLPATPPEYCAPSIELRKLGSDKASAQFASSDPIEAQLAQYALVPTLVVANWRSVAANGQAGASIREERRSLRPSRTRQQSRFLLPAGTVAGSYRLDIAIDGRPIAPARFKID
ncbi:energy transducer TonB [Pseudomonas sp. CGJS7]|uniref:energy transducer TonB n=1 Tax=Pseudomonas sp. CGJS7 TaxID=3109348 RepID=UPI003008B018